MTILLIILPFSLSALEIDNLSSKNVLVYDLDREENIYEKNADEKRPIASLTKMMTAIIVIENIDDLDEEVLITQSMLSQVPWDASTAGLEVGDELTYRDLLYALMLPSGADAASSLAILTATNEENFVKLMNQKAKELNLSNTSFEDVTGYDENNKSTVNDIKDFLIYALNNADFKEIFTASHFKTSNDMEFKSTVMAYSKYLDYDLSFIKGSKTGYIPEAGLCIAALIEVEGENLIVVTLNAEDNYGRNNHLKDLYAIKEKVEADFDRVVFYSEDDVLLTIKTKYAKEKEITIKSSEAIDYYLEGEYDETLLKIDYTGLKIVKYNTPINAKIGDLKIYYDDKLIEEREILLQNNLHFSLWNFIVSNIVYITLGIVLLFIIYIYLYCKINNKRLKFMKHR